MSHWHFPVPDEEGALALPHTPFTKCWFLKPCPYPPSFQRSGNAWAQLIDSCDSSIYQELKSDKEC